MRAELSSGVRLDKTVKLAAFLQEWLATEVASRVGAERTVEDYRWALNHVIRGLGHLSVSALTVYDVDRFLRAKAEAGLSQSYVGRMRMLLIDALRWAERGRLVTRNEAALSTMPKCRPRRERKPYTPDEIERFFAAAQGHRLEALFKVGLLLGLRPGELTGLLWSDVDLDGSPPTLAITGSMKRCPDGTLVRGDVKRSTAGVRTLALWPTLVVALRAHRKRQHEERLAMGGMWTSLDLVFPSEVGTPLDPSNLRHAFSRVCRRAELPGFPYLMRHTAVSVLLDAGATIDQIADLTGDDPVTVYRHYRHRLRPVALIAAELMPGIVG